MRKIENVKNIENLKNIFSLLQKSNKKLENA